MRENIIAQLTATDDKYACALANHTIPLGYLLGGWMVDRLFEPIMVSQGAQSLLVSCFGTGKGSGAALFFSVLWVMGIGVCLLFRRDKHIWNVEQQEYPG